MAIIGWGELFRSPLVAASSVLKHEAARFHQNPAPYTSKPIKPTSHYWPTSCALALGLPQRSPTFKTFDNSRSNFTKVPAELKFGILKSISEVKTLRSLAIASQPYHAVFEQNPKSVLSSILTSEINPEVFPVALAAAKSSKLRWSQETHFDQVNKFLSEYCEEDYDRITPSEVSARLLMTTSRLHDDVSYLAEDFVRSRTNKLSLFVPASEDDKLSFDPLSTHELKRIHRAFHLLQMFTNLFRNHDTATYPDAKARQITSDDIAGMFLSMVPAYQIEEMACVKDFIFDKLSDVFVDVQRELSSDRVTYVKYYPGQQIPELPSGFELEPDFHPAARWMSLDFPGCINLSPDGIAYDDLKETLLMKGLPYLRRLFQAPTSLERKRILLEDLAHDVHNCNTFHYALKAIPSDLLCDEEAYEAFYHQDEDRFESEEEGPNAGWAWANNNKVELRYAQWATEELRDWGYVMWDESRLEKMGVLALDSSQWRHERDGFKNTGIEDHPYHSRHLLHCLRGDEPKANNQVDSTGADKMEEQDIVTESRPNLKCLIQSSQEVFEETSSTQGEEESIDDEEFDEEMDDYVHHEEIIVAKDTLINARFSEGHEVNFDLFEKELFIPTDACLKTSNDGVVSDSESDVDLNPEDEDLLSDMQDDLKDEVAVKAISLELYEAALEACYSDQEDCSTSEDSVIISDSELANEIDEVIASNPTTDHADFAVDLDAASESSTSEGAAIITAVDLDVGSKNEPPFQEPANHIADSVVDHSVTPSLAFGSGSLESSIKFSEGWEKVPEQGSSSAFSFKSNATLWKIGETFALASVSDFSRQRAGSTSTLGTNSSCDSDSPTLPSSIAVEKASDPIPFVFGDKAIPGFNFDAPKTPTASCSNTTEATAKASFQFGHNSLNEFTLGGAKLPTMPLSSVLTSQSPKLSLSENIAPLPTPKPRKASSIADSGYGSGMPDKSLSPPPPDFVEWSRPSKQSVPIPNFLAARGITATLILDPTVEDVEDEYDAMLRINAQADLEPVWDPAAPKDSPAMKELKVEIAKKEQKERKEQDKPTEKLEVENGPVDELEEKKERLRAIVAQQADGRKKKGGKKGKKGKGKKGKRDEGDAGTTVEETSVDTDSDETPTEKTATSPIIAEKSRLKGKAQNCKSTGRARFRNGKGGQGLVQPGMVSVIL